MPKTAGPDFEKEFVKAIRANVKLVVDLLEAKNKGLSKRIQTFASRFAFPIASVEQKIRQDEMFRAHFAKDPGKQKIHEKIAASFIQQLPEVSAFESLPHNAKVVFQGAVSLRSEARSRGATSTAKTIDFEWTYRGVTVYASHKYTKESGGMQDNQYIDLQGFIREANESNLRDTYFFAIADGKYYSLQDTGSGTTKLERLKSLANRRNVFAVTTAEIEEFLKNLIPTK